MSRVRARVAISTAGALLALSTACAAAEEPVKASFLEGIWSTEEGCKRQAALDAGVEPNVETVPGTLSVEGYRMWEGSCSFTSIASSGPGQWTVKTSCGQEAEEWEDTETWVLDPGGARLEVALEGKRTVFVRCEAGKGQ